MVLILINVDHLSKPRQHLPGGHSCWIPMAWPGIRRGRLLSPCSSRYPARCDRTLARSEPSPGLRRPSRSPAAGRPPPLRPCSSCCRTPSPTDGGGAPPRAPRSGQGRSPGADELVCWWLCLIMTEDTRGPSDQV